MGFQSDVFQSDAFQMVEIAAVVAIGYGGGGPRITGRTVRVPHEESIAEKEAKYLGFIYVHPVEASRAVEGIFGVEKKRERVLFTNIVEIEEAQRSVVFLSKSLDIEALKSRIYHTGSIFVEPIILSGRLVIGILEVEQIVVRGLLIGTADILSLADDFSNLDLELYRADINIK